MKFNTDLIDGKTVFVAHNVECLERLLQYAEMGELDIEVETQGIRWAIEAYEDQKTCYSEKTMAIRPEIDSENNSIYFNRSSVGFYMEKGLVILGQHRINAKNRIIQWVPNKNCE